MHVAIIHPIFPGQFHYLATELARRGDRVSFVTSVIPPPCPLPYEVISYKVGNKPIPSQYQEQFCLEGCLNHAYAVQECLQQLPDFKPDVVLGHASFGTWLYLRPMYAARYVAYYEMLPPAPWTKAFDLRPDFPPPLSAKQFNMTAHTLCYLQLAACDAIYTPTYFQSSTLPREYRQKLSVIHDGVDCEMFQPRQSPAPCTFHGVRIGKDDKVVTYLSRGLESFRGFDVFYRAAQKIASEIPEVVFLVVGGEHNVYGHDLWYTDGLTFKDWCIREYGPPPARMHFLGSIPASDLPDYFALSDLHIYLTVPWVLSWSLVQAMASGCTLLVSDTAPLVEVIRHQFNGVRLPFYNWDAIAETSIVLMRDPDMSDELAMSARMTAVSRYSTDVCVPQIIRLLEGKHDAI